MARLKGSLISVTYDTSQKRPLDGRMLVSKKVDLINPTVWVAGSSTATSAFTGMLVSVSSDEDNNGVYYLNNVKGITEENYNNYKAAIEADSNATVDQYFSMWTKLSEVDSDTSDDSYLIDGGNLDEEEV